MSKKNKVGTLDTQTFRERFVDKSTFTYNLFKDNFETFFCLRIEDLIQSAKFPIPPSKETCHSLIFIVSGKYQIKVGFDEFKIDNKEILTIPAGQIFSLDSINKNVVGFLCHFNADVLVGKYLNKEVLSNFDFLKVWGNPKIKIDKQSSEFIFNLFYRLQIEYSEEGIKNLNIIQSYLIAILSEINQHYIGGIKKKYLAENIITDKFIELIFLHVKEKQKVNEYADLLNITSNHLNKSVSSVTGKSPTTWIDEIIITKAKYLLYQTELSITEIAYEVGQNDPSYFTRIFKKYQGVTPTDYRKLIDKS